MEDVLQKLSYIINPQVSSDLVGIHKHIERIESLLCNGSTNVKMLGIWGMGGIGKTTIVDVLFKKLYLQFEGCYFVENVKEELKIHGKLELRNKLLTQLLGDQKVYISTPSIHSTFVVDRLQRRKVLIVLDDVSDSQQIEDIIGQNDWLGPGSKIIVTTRNKDVLGNVGDVSYYEVMQLNNEEALHLFSLKAFHQDHPKEKFRYLSEMVVNYTMGLPLALKVLGSLLYSKSQGEWESALKKLENLPNAKIHHVLSLSYEGLDFDERNIFLDIACCLKGETKWHIKSLLDGCGFFTQIGLKSLETKSLISISKYGRVNMHDMIQEMGWQIVREESLKKPEKRSRLWDPEEIYHIFKHKMDIDHYVESISLDMSRIKDVKISSEIFTKMHKLRLLKFYLPYGGMGCRGGHLHVPEGLEFLLDELRYLCWYCFPLQALPTSFHTEMLVELDLKNSLIEKLWDGEPDLPNLKSLCLSGCSYLTKLPNFAKSKKLEEINLDYCIKLRVVPSSIFSLDHLLALDLEGCIKLRCIRSDVHSKSLRWLNLNFCPRLEEFSVDTEKLEFLSLADTAIEELPSSVGQARNLFSLSLSYCGRLNNLSNNFYNIGLGTRIDILSCLKLEKLPPMFETSSSITSLRISNCSNLSELPDNLGHLSALHELSVQGSSIETLPSSIKLLSRLRTLNVSGCERLLSLPELPLLLQELKVSECNSLETVSGSAATAHIQNCFGSQNKRLLLRQFHESKVSIHHQGFRERFDFTNCMRLDENGRNIIMDEAAIRIKSAACISSMLMSYLDPYHQFLLLFKDCHLQAALEYFPRQRILGSIHPAFHLLRKIESSASIIKYNADCCSRCKVSPFAFGLCLSNKEENNGLGFESTQRVCVQDLMFKDPDMLSYDKLWFNDVHVMLPGSKVPRFFRYQAAGNAVTFQLPPSSHLLGFAFCLVVSMISPVGLIRFRCTLNLKGARMFISHLFESRVVASDTVILCYAANTSNKILEAVKASIATDESASCNLELSFEFKGSSRYKYLREKEIIKECGVWPIYAFDLEPKKNKKMKKKRTRSMVQYCNWKCRWQALITKAKKNSASRFFKNRNGTNFSSVSRMKARMPKSSNEQQQQLPPRKKSKRYLDIDESADGARVQLRQASTTSSDN